MQEASLLVLINLLLLWINTLWPQEEKISPPGLWGKKKEKSFAHLSSLFLKLQLPSLSERKKLNEEWESVKRKPGTSTNRNEIQTLPKDKWK